jgi:hypothetical protein
MLGMVLRMSIQQRMNLVVLKCEFSPNPLAGHLLVEHINRRHGTSLAVVPLKTAWAALQDPEMRELLKVAGMFATDTIVALQTNIALDPVIVYVPEAYDGRISLLTKQHDGACAGTALAVFGLMPGDISENGNGIVLDIQSPETRLIKLDDFPQDGQIYRLDDGTCLPTGKAHNDGVWLWRRSTQDYVGPIILNAETPDSMCAMEIANNGMPEKFGVVAIASDADMAKLEALRRLWELMSRA